MVSTINSLIIYCFSIFLLCFVVSCQRNLERERRDNLELERRLTERDFLNLYRTGSHCNSNLGSNESVSNSSVVESLYRLPNKLLDRSFRFDQFGGVFNSFILNSAYATEDINSIQERESVEIDSNQITESRCDPIEENEVLSREDNGFLDLVNKCNASKDTCFDRKKARCICEDKSKMAFLSDSGFVCGLVRRPESFVRRQDCSHFEDLSERNQLWCIYEHAFETKSSFFQIIVPFLSISTVHDSSKNIKAIFNWISQEALPIPLSNIHNFGDYKHGYKYSLYSLLGEADLTNNVASMRHYMSSLLDHASLYVPMRKLFFGVTFYYFEPLISLDSLKASLGLDVNNSIDIMNQHPEPPSTVETENVETPEGKKLGNILSSLYKAYETYGQTISSFENFTTYDDCLIDCIVEVSLPSVNEVEGLLREEEQIGEQNQEVEISRVLLYLGGSLVRHTLVIKKNTEVQGVVQLNFSNAVSSYVSYQRYFNSRGDFIFRFKSFDRNWRKIGEMGDVEIIRGDIKPILSDEDQKTIQNHLISVVDIPNDTPLALAPLTLFCEAVLDVNKAKDQYDLFSILYKGPYASNDLESAQRSLMGWFPNINLHNYLDGLVRDFNFTNIPGRHTVSVIKDYKSSYEDFHNQLIGSNLLEDGTQLVPKVSFVRDCKSEWTHVAKEHNVKTINFSGSYEMYGRTCEHSIFAKNIRDTQDSMLWVVSAGNDNKIGSKYDCAGNLGVRKNLIIVSDDEGITTRGIHHADIVEKASFYDPMKGPVRGTSYSAPKVSAQATLLQTYFPNLTPNEIRWALIAGAKVPYKIVSVPQIVNREVRVKKGLWLWSYYETETREEIVYNEEKSFSPFEVRSGGKADIVCGYKAARYINQERDWTIENLLNHLYSDAEEVNYRMSLYRQSKLIE